MEIGSLVYVMWTEEGDMCGPEPGILREKAEKLTVEIVDGTQIKVPSYQVKLEEADLFEKYPENLKLVGLHKSDKTKLIKLKSQHISSSRCKEYNIHPLLLRWYSKKRLDYSLGRYYFSVLNQGQLGNYKCVDESLKNFLQINVQETEPDPREFQIQCDKIIKNKGPNCVVYSLANLLRRHPRILRILRKGGYPTYLLRLLLPKVDKNKCPRLPQKFWLPHETKSVSFLLLTNVLYVLAKKYPEEFKLHFDTSKRFKIQKGGAFQMITNMSLTNFFETMMNEQNLQDLDGMSLVVKRGASAGNLHKIAIGRCDKQLYFIDPNLKKL